MYGRDRIVAYITTLTTFESPSLRGGDGDGDMFMFSEENKMSVAKFYRNNCPKDAKIIYLTLQLST